MPQYKLYYFNSRGKAEVPRILFALAGVAYDDVRYEQDQWKAEKEKLKTPFGQLPCLSIDGVLYGQSISIAHYLANTFGFAGKTDLEKLRADMIVHCCEDMAQAIFKAFFYSDEKNKAELLQKLKDTDLDGYFTKLEAILKQNKGGDAFFVGDSITWADVTFVHFAEYIAMVGVDPAAFYSKYPKLKALGEKVKTQPKIAAWIAKRPTTQF